MLVVSFYDPDPCAKRLMDEILHLLVGYPSIHGASSMATGFWPSTVDPIIGVWLPNPKKGTIPTWESKQRLQTFKPPFETLEEAMC